MPTPHNSDEESPLEINQAQETHSPVRQNGVLPRAYSRTAGDVFHQPPPAYSTSSQSIPTGLKKWYSNEIFRVITFFILMISVLTVTTIAWFDGRLSSDQMLGVISTILMMAMPSALQGKSKKKVYYVNERV